MLEKIGEVAERAATSVSRRELLGRFGQGALVLAGVLGGLLAFPRGAAAGKPCYLDMDCPRGRFCCGGNCTQSPCPPVACNDSTSNHYCFGHWVGDICYSGTDHGLCRPRTRGGSDCDCAYGY